MAEIEKVAAAGIRGILLPATSPVPYHSPELDPVWAAARDGGVHVFMHVATGGVKTADPASVTMRTVRQMAAEVNNPLTAKLAAQRMTTQCIYGPIVPQQIIVQLIGGGVPERYPELHIGLIEFNAHWLVSLVGSMDKAWTNGIGQDTDWWLGYWDEDKADDDQPEMARMFHVSEK